MSPRVSPRAGTGTKENQEAGCCSSSVPTSLLSVDKFLPKLSVQELVLRNGLLRFTRKYSSCAGTDRQPSSPGCLQGSWHARSLRRRPCAPGRQEEAPSLASVLQWGVPGLAWG